MITSFPLFPLLDICILVLSNTIYLPVPSNAPFTLATSPTKTTQNLKKHNKQRNNTNMKTKQQQQKLAYNGSCSVTVESVYPLVCLSLLASVHYQKSVF